MQAQTIERPQGRGGLAEYYRALLEEQERSGLSVTEVAEVVGVTAATLYHWRRRLAGRGKAAEAGENALVRVRVAGPRGGEDGDRGRQDFVVRLRGGREIEVHPGFDGNELARLVEVLESC